VYIHSSTMNRKHLYTEIADEIRKRISHGDYAPGSRIPGHTRLAREFGVSPITSNRALQELVKEGLVERRERIGSFVSTQALRLRKIAIVVSVRAGDTNRALSDYIRGILGRTTELGVESSIHYLLGSDMASAEWMQLQGTNANGFICIGPTQYDTYITAGKLGRPLVVVGTNVPPGDYFVTENRKDCTRDLVRAMREDGYRRIGFIGNLYRPDHRTSRDGYLEGIADLGLGFRLIRDANEETIGAVVKDLLAEDLGVEGVIVMGGNLSIAALPLIMIQRPQVKFGCLRENASVAPLADVSYYGEYFQEEVGRMAVDLLVDVYTGKVKGSCLRFSSYRIQRPRIATHGGDN